MAGNAIVGALRVTLGLDSAAFENGMDAAQKKLKAAGSSMQSVGTRMAGIGAGMSAAITAPFIALGAHLLQGSQDAAHAAGQVNAALESMGGASGKTADELSKTADSLRNLTGIDDDEILTKVTSNLLTFGNVAGTVFDRAQVAALDLATRMGGDLQAATLTIGKALNDPVKGLTALGRAGIQFTAQQKEQIKQMVAVGDAAGAQSIMLAELEKQFGGAAKAAGDADAWKPLKTALMDLEGAFEPIVRDVIAPLIAKAGEIVRAFASVSPEVQQFVAVGAAVAAAIGPLLIAFGGLVAAAGAIATAFAGGGVLAGLLPFLGPIGIAAAAVAAAFMIWGDDIVPMLQTFGRQLADSIGPKIKPLFDALMGAVKAVGEIFSAIFSMGGTGSASGNLKIFGDIVARVLGAAVEIITGAVNVITNVLRALAALLRGDFSTMWNALGSAVRAVVTGVLKAFEALFPGVIGYVRQLVEGVTSWLQGRLGAVLGWVIGKVKSVGDAFFQLYDAVVGHSYVPDMVEGVAAWMAKLDAGMVQPARNATDAAKSAFQKLRDDVAVIMEGLLTDAERNAREVADKIAKIRALAAQGGLTAKEAATAEAGVWGENLQAPTPVQISTAPLIDPDALPQLESLGNTTAQIGGQMQEAINGIRGATQSLTDGLIDLALTGEGSLGDLLKSFVATVAKIILEMLALKAVEMATGIPVSAMVGGGGTGGGGGFFKNLLGFAHGGSFEVGGSGSVDSKLVAFRATPGERVDISTPGQQRQQGGYQLTVNPSPYFDVQVEKIAAPVATEVAMAGSVAATQHVFKTLRQERERSRYTRSGY